MGILDAPGISRGQADSRYMQIGSAPTGAALPAIAQFVGGTYNEVRQAKDFFVGGAPDDTLMLQAACVWLEAAPNRALALEHCHNYTINGSFKMTNASFFRIEGNGAWIRAANGMSSIAETQILYLVGCTDGVITDLNIDGNRANRVPQEVTNHSIDVFTGCARITFLNCRSINAVCDPWFVDSNTPTVLSSIPTDITLVNCVGDNAYRNGLSVVNSVRFRCFNGVFTNSNGTAPQGGVDVESDQSAHVGNIDCQFFNLRVEGNSGFGFTSYVNNSFVSIHGLICKTMNTEGVISGTYGYLFAEDIEIENCSNAAAGLINLPSGAGETHLKNVTGRNNNTGSDSNALIYVDPAVTGPIYIEDVVVYTSTHAVLDIQGKCVVNRVAQFGTNALWTVRIKGSAAGTYVTGVVSSGTLNSVYVNAPDVTINNVQLINNTNSGGPQIEFDTLALRASLDRVENQRTTALPSGQLTVQFLAVPFRATNIVSKLASGAFTATQNITWTASSAGVNLNGNFPPST